MTRLGLLSDVHANLPALEAVLADMPAVDAVVCCGDVVGFNCWPAACVERVRAVADVTVAGNHDRDVDAYARERAESTHRGGESTDRPTDATDPIPVPDDLTAKEGGLWLAAARLTANQRDWLASLPEAATVEGHLVVHSHPDPDARWRPGGAVYAAEFPRMVDHLDGYDGLFLGHKHRPHAWTDGETLVCNPGPVGITDGERPRAHYAVVDVAARTADVRAVPYDADRVRRRLRAAFPAGLDRVFGGYAPHGRPADVPPPAGGGTDPPGE